MDAIYAHARLYDLDLDSRSQWVGKATNQRGMLSATREAISIQLATTVGYCLRDLDLDLKTFILLTNLFFVFKFACDLEKV